MGKPPTAPGIEGTRIGNGGTGGKIDVLTGLIGSSRNQGSISRTQEKSDASTDWWQTTDIDNDWLVQQDTPRAGRPTVIEG